MVSSETLMAVFFICLFFFIIFKIGFTFIRARKRQLSQDDEERVIAVKAVVVDKYKMPVGANVYGNFTPVKYVVVFLVGNEKMSFEVSEYSFNNYKIKESGTLKYCGNELIDFG